MEADPGLDTVGQGLVDSAVVLCEDFGHEARRHLSVLQQLVQGVLPEAGNYEMAMGSHCKH